MVVKKQKTITRWIFIEHKFLATLRQENSLRSPKIFFRRIGKGNGVMVLILTFVFFVAFVFLFYLFRYVSLLWDIHQQEYSFFVSF